ncbi:MULTISPECIES: DegT/DnrJ/EryC1/StrS family aminotransferase [unclassified Actinopolyspora]|uniref:DegT/DnrJ/EryC1/StrS family aminotransferase n=1 Tax=unclassified Actinopolyspora TaxID=2639451 RepID=UPI0013F608DB|nr:MULTISPECIES: DegT/DnrJ/EryC1/StrS family aminotransferase [unclassified Actinopolyspora]NHD19318.1 DegT/DnrJ/EryC1/StrS family aminotransferase [Actinopolyspora sp. BKK2]NHE78442.1 DegT/DnrJ/EryC1/StrS family aminotransferase [Actinopolyspora sp. BKK1]
MINLFQPQVGELESTAITEVMDSRWIGHGPRTTAFEEEFARHLKVEPEHVLFLASGTASLFLAVELLGLGLEDEVVLPSVNFVAAANSVLASGATPVFCDVDERTLNPSVEDVAAVVTPRTRAVIVLHYGGHPGDITAITRFCAQRGLELIEDAACSVASRVDGRAVGTFGNMAFWSFDAMKVLTTGDGGMLYIRDRERAEQARRLAYHGLAVSSGLRGARIAGQWWKMDVAEPGRRIIGNDLTAAMGSVQLGRLTEFITRRRELTELYDYHLEGVEGLDLPPPPLAGHESSYYFYWVQIDADLRDDVAADLFRAGIYTTFRYEPLHFVPIYGFTGSLPHTERLARRTLCLPLHPGLSNEDVSTVSAELIRSLAHRRASVQTADN